MAAFYLNDLILKSTNLLYIAGTFRLKFLMAKKAQTKSPSTKAIRHQFRANYKIRCIYSFGESVITLHHANVALQKPNYDCSKVGLHLVTCYRSVAHSLEMLCKSSLDRISPYLTLQKLESFDELKPKNKEEHTCVGRVALARASKILKYRISEAEIGLLFRFIEKRNECEHRELNIKNLKNAVKEIVPAQELIIKLFNKEFRDGALLKECDRLYDKHKVADLFESVALENSEEFEKIFKRVARLKKKQTVLTCLNCFYEAAIVDLNGKKYKCEMCEDEKVLKKCYYPTCSKELWVSATETNPDCNGHMYDILKTSMSETFEKYKAKSTIFTSPWDLDTALTFNYTDLKNMTLPSSEIKDVKTPTKKDKK